MSRSRRLFVLVAGGLLVLTGCRVRLEVATEVAEDGSGQMAVTVLLGETVRQTLSQGGLVSEDPEELRRIIEEEGPDALRVEDSPDPVDVLAASVPAGWGAEPLEEGKLRGLRLSAGFSSVDEIPGLLAPFDDWGDEVAARQGADAEQVGVTTLVRGFEIVRDGPIFRFRAEPDVRVYEGATGGPNNLGATFTISLELPGGIREHDADEKSGGTLTWEIAPGTSRSISATSDLTYDPSGFPVVPVGLAAGGVVGAVVVGWVLWRRRSRVEDGEPPPDGEVAAEVPVPV